MYIHNSKNLVVIFHVLVWIVLFSFPYLLSSGQEQLLIRVIAHSWFPLLMYAFLFYINYLWLINGLMFKKQWVIFALVNIMLIAGCIYLREIVTQIYFHDTFPTMPDDGKGPPVKLFIYVQIISFLIPLFFAVALKITERWIKTEAERKEAVNIKLQSELQHLKYQLQPHFFFNSLNNIYSLVDMYPEKAKETIHSLSKLMRYLLYETNTERVPLHKELEFMEKYIELMKLRVSENVSVNYSFPVLTHDVQIAPLLFISLVENAFKHGVPANRSAAINFEMKVESGLVSFSSANLNVPKTSMDRSGSGIGLVNLEKRLKLLYHDKYAFENRIKDGIFISNLTITLV